MISDDELFSYLRSLQQKLQATLQQPLSESLAARFLTGMTCPYLTRIRARQLSGYASCQEVRYSQVVEAVQRYFANSQ